MENVYPAPVRVSGGNCNTQGGGMPELPVTIKRYDNRRLYSPMAGAYLSLEDLAEMVREDEEFVVQDARTKEDVTGAVLRQIIRRQAVHG
jgi:polyhydroxyalkanoate synthesis regulator protein